MFLEIAKDLSRLNKIDEKQKKYLKHITIKDDPRLIEVINSMSVQFSNQEIWDKTIRLIQDGMEEEEN